MDFDIAGRRAIVCGGNSGLGFAIAEALAREGVAVFLVARNQARLEKAADPGDSADNALAARSCYSQGSAAMRRWLYLRKVG